MAKKNPLGDFDKKEIDAFIDAIKRGQKETALWREALDGFSSTFFGFSASAFFKEVPKSIQQMTAEFKAANAAVSDLNQAGLDFQMAFKNKAVTDNLGNTKSAVETLRASLNRTMTDGTKMMDDVLTKMELAALNGESVWSSLSLEEQVRLGKMLNEEGFEFLNTVTDINEKADILQSLLFDEEESIIRSKKDLLKQLATHESIRDVMQDEVRALTTAEQRSKNLRAEFDQKTKAPNFLQAINNGLQEMSKNFIQKIMTNLNEVDIGIHEIQKSTGVMIAENTEGLAHWTSGMAQYGMSIKDAGEMMEGLGSALATTDQGVLMDATFKFRMMSKALGISNEEMTSISASMMKVGSSADDVAEAMSLANKSAKLLGVSTKRVTQQIAKNIDKMQSLGFKGGVEALTLMAAKAEKLGMQVDDIFNVAERARTIEGAMDMAAQLQLAGGSFANINPMELLSAARNSPEELRKILTTMGKDLGHWNKETGTYDFNPIDADRIRIAAEAAGMSVEKFQDMIRKGAIMDKKMGGITESTFSSIASSLSKDIKGIDGEMAKSMLGDFLELGEDGEVKLTMDARKAKLLDKAGIKSIADLNESNIRGLLDINNKDQKSLKEQAAQNMALSESFNAFTASLTNLFTVFQPVLNFLGEAINKFSDGIHSVVDKLNNVYKGLGDYLVPIVLSSVVIFKSGIGKVIKGAIATLGGKLKFGKKDADESGGIGGLASSMRQASDESGGIKMGNIMKFAAALGIIGVAVIGFMAGLNAIGGTPGLAQLAGAAGSMVILGGGIWALSKISPDNKNIVQMALAMGIIGAAVIPFAFAMKMMGDVKWPAVVAALGFMALAVLGVMALGAIMESGVGAAALLVGALALVAVGAAMALAGAGFLAAATAMEKLAGIDWGGITKMGAAMLSAAPGMIAFGIATMAFANPIAMIGMGLMVLQLGALAFVMIPLSEALITSSKAMERFVVSMNRLKGGVNGADIGGVFDSVAGALERLNDVMEDSDMDKITQALSSIRVNIDTSSVDGLRNAITDMPSIIVHVDRSEMDRITASLSSMKLGIDLREAERELALLPSAKVSLDTKGLREEMRSLPEMSIKFDKKALADAVSMAPSVALEFDIKSLIDAMKSAPSLEIGVNEQALVDAMSSVPPLSVRFDISALLNAMASVPEVAVKFDLKALTQAIASVPPLSIGVDEKALMNAFSSMPMLKVGLDSTALKETIDSLPSITIGVDEKAFSDSVSNLPALSIVVDRDKIIEALSSIPAVNITVDTRVLLEQISALPMIKVLLDMQTFMDQIAKISNTRVELDVASMIDAPPLSMTIDKEALMKQIDGLPALTFRVDLSALSGIPPVSVSLDGSDLERQIAAIPPVQIPLAVSSKAVLEAFASIPALVVRIDMSEVRNGLSSIPPIVIGFELSGLNEIYAMISDSQPIEVMVDTNNIMDVIDMMDNVQLTIDASQVYEAVDSIPSIRLMVDTSSITDQLSALPPFIIGVDRSEIDKMAMLLSSIRISLDVSAIESAVSGLKIGVDTAQLDRSVSDLRAINMEDISSSLASIEATISKSNESRIAAVKVTSDDLGSSTNKMQMEMMSQLTAAVDRLTASSSKESQAERRIVIELEMDGRQMKTKILKDTNIMT